MITIHPFQQITEQASGMWTHRGSQQILTIFKGLKSVSDYNVLKVDINKGITRKQPYLKIKKRERMVQIRKYNEIKIGIN